MILGTLLLLLSTASATHYKALGLPPGASASEVKLAYRKAALEHHPDRLPKSASTATRQRSQRIFEEANEAFEVLGDPAKRRQYDFDLANPVQKGEDGIFRQGEPGATPPRPRVEVRVEATLAQLGGWEETEVPLSAWSSALGATVTEDIALRLGLPLRLYLPAGSRQGDAVSRTIPSLGGHGVDVDFMLVAKPHRHMERRGNTLHVDAVVPAWRSLWLRPIRVRGVDGTMLTVKSHGAMTKQGEKITLAGQGMPILGSADAVRDADRGSLHVQIRIRSLPEEAALVAGRGGAAAAAVLTGRAAARCVRM